MSIAVVDGQSFVAGWGIAKALHRCACRFADNGDIQSTRNFLFHSEGPKLFSGSRHAPRCKATVVRFSGSAKAIASMSTLN